LELIEPVVIDSDILVDHLRGFQPANVKTEKRVVFGELACRHLHPHGYYSKQLEAIRDTSHIEDSMQQAAGNTLAIHLMKTLFKIHFKNILSTCPITT